MAGVDTNALLSPVPMGLESGHNKRLAMDEAQRRNMLLGVQLENHQQQLAEQQRAARDRETLRSIYAQGTGPDLEERLYRSGFPQEGARIGKDRRESRKLEIESEKAGLETALKRVELQGRILNAVKDQAGWDKARPVLGALGFDASQMPQQYDPEFIQQGVAWGMDTKDQLAASLDRAKFHYQQYHDAQTRGETNRHNLATENKPQFVPVPEVGLFVGDPRTGTATEVRGPGGAPIRKPTPGEKASAERAGKAPQILEILDEADKLIPQATGSYAGAGADIAGAAVGSANTGSRAIAQLKVLQAQLMLAQPRMEGPQSDRDVQLYREAAASLGDPTVPRQAKQDAANMIRALNEKYAGMQPGASKPAASSGQVKPAPGAPKPAAPAPGAPKRVVNFADLP